MQALKIAVIVMGVLIVIGMGLLIYGIATRIATGEGEGAAAGVAAPSSALPAPGTFGDVAASLPEGAEVLDATSDGRRLLVRIALLGGGQQVLVFDLDTGASLGRLTMQRGGEGE